MKSCYRLCVLANKWNVEFNCISMYCKQMMCGARCNYLYYAHLLFQNRIIQHYLNYFVDGSICVWRLWWRNCIIRGFSGSECIDRFLLFLYLFLWISLTEIKAYTISGIKMSNKWKNAGIVFRLQLKWTFRGTK